MLDESEVVDTPINELTYPIEYFIAQVAFAKEWAKINSVSLDDAILNTNREYS